MLRSKEINNSLLNGHLRFVNAKHLEIHDLIKAGYFRPNNAKYSYENGFIIFENFECVKVFSKIHAHVIFDYNFIIKLIKTRSSFPVNWISYPYITKKDIMDNYSLIEGMFPNQILDIIQRFDAVYKSCKEPRRTKLPRFAESFDFQQKCLIMVQYVDFLKN